MRSLLTIAMILASMSANMPLRADVERPPAAGPSVDGQTPSANAPAAQKRDEQPWTLPYIEGAAIPHGYVVQQRQRTGVLIAGGVTLTLGYAASYVVGAVSNARRLTRGESPSLAYYTLYIPIVGPFIGLETIEPNTAEAASLITSAALQIGGAATIIVGLTTHEKRLLRTANIDLRLNLSATGAHLVGQF